MSKQFKIITNVTSNEVSLCTKYNSGANKQTEFEIIKDKANEDKDIKPVIQNMIKIADLYTEMSTSEEKEEYDSFKEFLNYWLEYDVNNCYYNLLSEALQNALSDIKYREDIDKEQKVEEYKKLFNSFIEEYKKMPITKNKDGKYDVSLISKSLIKDEENNPQNETVITEKENVVKMQTEKKMNIVEKAFEMLKSVLVAEQENAPAEEKTEVEKTSAEEKTAEVETPETEKPAEQAEEATKEEAQKETKEEDEKTEVPAEEKVETEKEIEKTAETSELAEMIEKNKNLEDELKALKKAQEEKELEVEKMNFIQKAKDEFSMLSGISEEIADRLLAISKSNLDDSVKDFVFEQLKKVSEENKEMTQEVGSITKNASDMTEEDVIYAKAEEIAKAKNISINKALREVK